ncbi:11999_t:CDS:10 [Funneliformis geosporum]|uniref:Mediator of RNA polymerase II transcription subunit 12 n=1 Tax=Funneliformis geosporum TaxID=1117311 RepID=A0A9W4SMD4_9GLOM|nr:11999_t:CDS:10 [Funneliformis geosporum]CAI2174679.1 7518_t:CDS:10 [Funneliformis geosporum]
MSQQRLQKYELVPPKNLAPFHRFSTELGYPDFYPPKPGQDEDQMTEENVKRGFVDVPFVKNEFFPAHDILSEQLRDPNILKNLGDFMTDVMRRKNETNTFQGSSQFIVPTIVWVPSEERDKWLNDLAGNVPLKILAKNVPKGIDGINLLDLVTQNRVPLARATWFTKIVGINHRLQNHHRSAATEYTKNWTLTFNTFIRKQSSNYDPAKWKYWHVLKAQNRSQFIILLAKWQFDEQLLDQRLLRWTLENLIQADHWQTAMWLWLVQQFLSEFQRSRTLMRLLIETIIKKLQDMNQNQAVSNKLGLVIKKMKNMLLALFLTTPDMFVFPVCWNTYKELLRCVLLEDSSTDTPISKDLKRQRERYYEMVRSRNEMFDEKKLNPLGMGNLQEALLYRMISILDKVNCLNDYHSITKKYFRMNGNFLMEREISTLIYTLCYWAITSFREGDFRVYSASTILDIWKNEVSAEEKLEQRQSTIQSSLVEFLDVYPLGKNELKEEEELEMLSRLFGELTRNGHFSYQRYLQRLIARGDVRHEKRNTERSLRHLRYVKWFAIYEPELHDLNQRWHILYGVNIKDTTDEREFDTFVNIISKKLPNMLSPKANDFDAPMVDDPISDFTYSLNFDNKSLDFIKHTTKFCQLRVIQEFLTPSVKQFVQNAPIDVHNWRNPTQPGSSLLNARQLATIIQVIELTKDYSSLLELIIWVLENSMERSIFPLIVDTIKRHERIWEAMNKSDVVFDVLMKKNDQLREKRKTEICIVKYLLNIVHDDKKLKSEMEEYPNMSQLSEAIRRHKNRLGSDIDHLLNQTDGFKISNVDERLFDSETVDGYLYHILMACTDVIHLHARNYADLVDARKLLDIFGDLLRDVGDRATNGFDTVFKNWLNINIRADDDDSLLRQHSTYRLLIFFIILVVRHLVKMETVLEYLVEKNLSRLSDKLLSQKKLDPDGIVECQNLVILLRLLLMHHEHRDLIPLTIMEIQTLQSICESFIHNKEFIIIISSIFHKLAIIENSIEPDNDLVIELRNIRIDFAQVYWFRQLCIANVDNVYNNFVKGNKRLINNKEIERRMIDIIQSGLGNPNDGINGHSISFCFANLHKIFSTVNLWNIQKSRVEFYMCMDKILLLSDAFRSGSILSPILPYNIKESDDDSIMEGSEEEMDKMKRVIEYFWQKLVLQGNKDCLVISHIIQGIREDIASELMERGLVVLERCDELIAGIEEVFRALLLSIGDNKKLEFSKALLSQVQRINDENKSDTYVSCVMARIKLFVLVANVLAARVTAVVTSNKPDLAKLHPEYDLIMKWVILLINLLCDERIHQNGGGANNFDLVLDIVSFLLDEMGKNARAIIVAELKRYQFNVPAIWSNRIKRVLPLKIPQETLGERKHQLDAWQLIEGIGENDDLNNSSIDLSWYDAKVYPRPSKRLKRIDEYEDYNIDLNKKYEEEDRIFVDYNILNMENIQNYLITYLL